METPTSSSAEPMAASSQPNRSRFLSTRIAAIVALVTGSLLGVLAVAADFVGGGGGMALIAVVSTGLSWGAAAGGLGATVRRPVPAAVVAAAVLLLAVIVYYEVSVAAGMRESSGDIVAATLAWGAAAMAAGSVLGPAAWLIRSGTSIQRAVAAGVMGGLLSSQGVSLWWRTRDLGFPGLPVLTLILFLVAAPTAGALLLSHGRRLLSLAVLAVVASLSAVAWSMIVGHIA